MNLIVIIIAILVVILFRYLRSPTRIGKIGESRVAWEIDRLDVNNFRVFNDLLLQHNEETCQIDHIIISIYGIFVIETKNYSGWIFGNDSSDYWTQVIYKTKNKFRNPIKQNWSHICFLKTILRERASIKYIPIVAFAGNAELKAIKSDTLVTYVDLLYQKIMERCIDICMTSTEVNEVSELIKTYSIEKSNTNRYKHIEQINSKITEREKEKQSMLCPLCGMQLVDRKGPYGEFLGCSGYPNCKYTRKY